MHAGLRQHGTFGYHESGTSVGRFYFATFSEKTTF